MNTSSSSCLFCWKKKFVVRSISRIKTVYLFSFTTTCMFNCRINLFRNKCLWISKHSNILFFLFSLYLSTSANRRSATTLYALFGAQKKNHFIWVYFNKQTNENNFVLDRQSLMTILRHLNQHHRPSIFRNSISIINTTTNKLLEYLQQTFLIEFFYYRKWCI